MTRIRADFNSVGSEGLVRSDCSRADGPFAIGDRVVVHDADGNECEATVIVLDRPSGRVRLQLDVSTWQEGEPDERAAADAQHPGRAAG